MQQNEEMFRVLAETMAAATFLHQGAHFMYVNSAAAELTGYTREELLSRNFWELVHPDHRAAIRERAMARLRGDPIESRYEIKILTRSGEVRWVDFTAGTIAYNNGVAVLGTAFDITARKQAEDALRERERALVLLQRVTAAASEATTLPDVLHACLRALCELGGWAAGRAYLVGAEGKLETSQLWYAMDQERRTRFHLAEGEAANHLVERVLQYGHAISIPDLRGSRGPMRPPGEAERGLQSVFAVPVRIRDRVCAVLELFSERSEQPPPAVLKLMDNVCAQISRVFERQEAEQAIRKSEQHYRTLMERISDVVYVLDAEFRVRYISPSAERILGYQPEEVLGSDGMEFVHPADRDEALAKVQARVQGVGVTGPVEVRLRHRDGSYRSFGVLADIIPSPTGPPSVVVTSHDITERKQLEEQLRHAQKMDAVGRLAGGVAHDFNNLLTAIIGNADLLLYDIPEDNASRIEVEEIRRAAERAAALTQQLLAFGRRQVLQLEVVRLDRVAAGMEKMLRRLIGENIELVTHSDPELGQVKVDAGQIEQVVMNLVVNARDAMPNGGSIVLRVENVEMDDELASSVVGVVPGQYVKLCVEDDGCGMDETTLARAFEPFFTTKEQGKGTGLGLSTVYGIVRQSGGHIRAHSRPGEGTTIAIYLPRVDEVTPLLPDPAPLSRVQVGDSETVLLVDDQEPVRSMAHRTLVRAGYQVLEAAGGESAIRLFRERAPDIDLLITDMLMPKVNGQQVLEACRAMEPDLPVILMSGYTSDPLVQRGLLEPGVLFLQKPFTPAGLAQMVREVLGQVQDGSSGSATAAP